MCIDSKQSDSTIENIIDFIEANTDAEIIHIDNSIDVY
ncbi:MAG: hypothetical protein ACRC1Y_00450 [Paraclostridium sp.]